MRIKLTLRALDNPSRLPINYNYPFSAVLYKILQVGSPEYSEWLHSHGYHSDQGRSLKLFTFSKIQTPHGVVRGDCIILPRNRHSYVYISSPMLDHFAVTLLLGLFASKNVTIVQGLYRANFAIDCVERVTLPPFVSPVTCVALSPYVIETKVEWTEGRFSPFYLPVSHPDFSNTIRTNLITKYSLIHNHPPADDQLTAIPDTEYIQRRGGDTHVTKLIRIKEDTTEETCIRAIVAPICLTGSKELIDTAMEAGIGVKNSLGFGMLAPRPS